jgi:hypothetical protein
VRECDNPDINHLRVISFWALGQSFATCRFQCRASKGASSGPVTRWACMPDSVGMGNARRRPEGAVPRSRRPSLLAARSLTLLPNSQPPASFSPRPARPNKTLVPPSPLPQSPFPHRWWLGTATDHFPDPALSPSHYSRRAAAVANRRRM